MEGKSLIQRLAWFEDELSYAFGSEGPYGDPADWFKANRGEFFNLLLVIRDALDQIRRQ